MMTFRMDFQLAHVALDNCLILSDVEAVAGSREVQWTPLLLILPLRLGLTSLNPCYIGALKVGILFLFSLDDASGS